MNKTLDDFSRNLATGMSRRKAFLKFLGGAGALGFLTLGKAKAGAGTPKAPSIGQCEAACVIEAGELLKGCLAEKGANVNLCIAEAYGEFYPECVLGCSFSKPKP